jgi:hypothetical protein
LIVCDPSFSYGSSFKVSFWSQSSLVRKEEGGNKLQIMNRLQRQTMQQLPTTATNKEGDEDVVDDNEVYDGIEKGGDGGGQE